MFESFRVKKSVERVIDEKFYEQVAYEIDAGDIKAGLWTKATANSNGNEAQIKSLYIQYRVQSIADEIRILSVSRKDSISSERLIKEKKSHKKNYASRTNSSSSEHLIEDKKSQIKDDNPGTIDISTLVLLALLGTSLYFVL